MDNCTECRIQSLRTHGPINSLHRDGSKLLFLVDYPTAEDAQQGIILSGLNKRSVAMSNLLHECKINESLISFASVSKCVTKSKSIGYPEYEVCGKHVLDEIDRYGIRGIVAFGSVAARLLLGKKVDNIDTVRGRALDTILPGSFCIITYALGILADDEGCGSCGKSVHITLARKDLNLAASEAERRRL